MAKLQARTWLSRAVSSSFSSVLTRCAKCTRLPRSCLYLCQIFTYFNFFLTRRLSNKPFLIWLLTTPSRLKYVARLRCNLSLMACFADINVSQGSVATYARCGGSFNIYLTTHLPRSFALIFLNRLRFDRIMVMGLWPTFLAHLVYYWHCLYSMLRRVYVL